MRPKSTYTKYKHNNLRNRLATLQKTYAISETARQILQSELEATALHWFLEAGGTEAEFDKLFNSEK